MTVDVKVFFFSISRNDLYALLLACFLKHHVVILYFVVILEKSEYHRITVADNSIIDLRTGDFLLDECVALFLLLGGAVGDEQRRAQRVEHPDKHLKSCISPFTRFSRCLCAEVFEKKSFLIVNLKECCHHAT